MAVSMVFQGPFVGIRVEQCRILSVGSRHYGREALISQSMKSLESGVGP